MAIAFVALMAAPPVRSSDTAAIVHVDEISTTPAKKAPVILAQGRCFNGRCF